MLCIFWVLTHFWSQNMKSSDSKKMIDGENEVNDDDDDGGGGDDDDCHPQCSLAHQTNHTPVGCLISF